MSHQLGAAISYDLKSAHPKPEKDATATTESVLAVRILGDGGGGTGPSSGSFRNGGSANNSAPFLGGNTRASAGGVAAESLTRVAIFLSSFNLIELELTAAQLREGNWATRYGLFQPTLAGFHGNAGAAKDFQCVTRRWNVAQRHLPGGGANTNNTKGGGGAPKYDFNVLECCIGDDLTVLCLIESQDGGNQSILLCQPKTDVILGKDASAHHLDAFFVNTVPLFLAPGGGASTAGGGAPVAGGGGGGVRAGGMSIGSKPTGTGTSSNRIDGVSLHPSGASFLLFQGPNITPVSTSDFKDQQAITVGGGMSSKTGAPGGGNIEAAPAGWDQRQGALGSTPRSALSPERGNAGGVPEIAGGTGGAATTASALGAGRQGKGAPPSASQNPMGTNSTALANVLAASYLQHSELFDYWVLTSDGCIRFHARSRAALSFASAAHGGHVDPNNTSATASSGARNGDTSPARTSSPQKGAAGGCDSPAAGKNPIPKPGSSTAARTTMGVSVTGGMGEGRGDSGSKYRPSFHLKGGALSRGIPCGEGVTRNGKIGFVKVHHPALAAAINDANLNYSSTTGAGSPGAALAPNDNVNTLSSRRRRSSVGGGIAASGIFSGTTGASSRVPIVSQTPDGSCALLVFPVQFVAFKVLVSLSVVEGKTPSCFDIIQEIPLEKSEGVVTSVINDGARGFIMIRKNSNLSTTGAGGGAADAGKAAQSVASRVRATFISLCGELKSLGSLSLESQVLLDPKSKSGHLDSRLCIPVGTTNNGSHVVTMEAGGTIAQTLGLPTHAGLDLLLTNLPQCEYYLQCGGGPSSRHYGGDGGSDRCTLSTQLIRKVNAAVALELSRGTRRVIADEGGDDLPKTAFVKQPALGPVYEVLHSCLNSLGCLLLEVLEFTPIVNLPGDEQLPPEEEEDTIVARQEEMKAVVEAVLEAIACLAAIDSCHYTYDERCLFLPIYQILLGEGALSSCWQIAAALELPSFFDLLLPVILDAASSRSGTTHPLKELVMPRCSKHAQALLHLGVKVSRTIATREHEAKNAPDGQKPKTLEEIQEIVKAEQMEKLSLLDGFELGYGLLTTKGPKEAAQALQDNFTKHAGCSKNLIELQKRLEQAALEIPSV